MSRRARQAAVLVGLVSLAGGAVVVAMRRASAPPSPVLLVRSGHGSAPPPSPETGEEERAMALALVSISPAERQRVIELMSYTTARLEARLSPLGDDFGDEGGEPVLQFRHAMGAYMPSFTAARELVHGKWQSVDIAVRAASTCKEAMPGESCLSLWDVRDERPELGRRARFLAWAVTSAAVFDAGTRERVETCARMLRERLTLESSPMALVITADDLAAHAVPEGPALQDAARRLGRAMAANDVEDTTHLAAFAHGLPAGRGAPWLTLPPTVIVVVPRLSALARPDALVHEIESAAAGSPIRWLHHP